MLRELEKLYDEWALPTTFILLGLLVLGAFGMMLMAMLEHEKQWQEFKVTHHCVVVAHISGDVFNTIAVNPNGGGVSVGIGATPDKTGWKCDNGVTYYR